MTGYDAVLAHHALVETLPAVIPMVVLVGAFSAIVVADRRRSRREDESGPGPAAPDVAEQRP
ncbi:MAG: hypothetical protein JWO60_799 [Frankiales bacterium]|nr:hypothetical protein [Frankiales bacterium]